MFLGRYSGSFFVGGVIVALEVYGLSGCLFTSTGVGPPLEVLGPIPTDSVLTRLGFIVRTSSSFEPLTLYFGLSGSKSTGVDALEASGNLITGGTTNPRRSFLGLQQRGGSFSGSWEQLFIGRKILGGPKWLIFGAESLLPTHTIMMHVTIEIAIGGGGDRATAGGGTVLDVLRASAAESL